MAFFSDWDDLVHGTLVFGAALPFAIALVCGLLLTARPWMGVGLALTVSLLWLFGAPDRPFGSDDAVVCAFLVAVLLAGLDGVLRQAVWVRPVAAVLLLGALAWAGYPAWLAADGGIGRKVLVSGLLAVSVGGFATTGRWLVRGPGAQQGGITPAALVPAGAAVAVLLATGGASQFAQAAGAVTATIAAVSVIPLLRGGAGAPVQASTVWLVLLGFLAWAGWLYAEIRPLAAALAFLSPAAALAARRLPLPRRGPALVMLWDLLAAALFAGAVAAVVLAGHMAAADEFSGY